MSFFSFLTTVVNPFRPRAQPGKPWFQRVPLEQVAAPTPTAPQWSEEQQAGLDQYLEQPQGELDGFLHFGVWLSVESSNVAACHYDADQSMLEIRYRNGNYYAYRDVSIREAEAFARAASKGGWVWDNLRRRGSVFGWRKPYVLLSGVSAGKLPQWMRSSGTRALHGKIGPHGAPNKSVEKRLMPKSFKGLKAFQPHTFPIGKR